VLMHECAHKSLFRTKWMNEVFGQWLCAYPIRFDMLRYRAEHMVHHKYAQTDRDPDLWLTAPFPTTPRGLRRKLTRDLLGQTGLRRVVGLFLLDIGYLEGSAPKVTKNANWTPREGLRRGFERLWRPVLFHAAFLAILTAFGHPELFLLWWAAYMTTYSVVLRIRAIAEHSVVPDVTDPWRHTRTTLASPLERAFLAPNWVNYHLEHHLIPNVPCYNLPAMHRMLRDRGALAETDAAVAKGYGEVLRLAASAQAVQPTPA
ncbi:MAG: fatty acid desaturase family protein, partial [Candidatus Methylomirabilis sp.]|nr:fatty acid desaturase family protein [Deltaproteobacteria bacterium]